MQTYLNENNLVDLISDKHAKLRKKVIEAWVQNGEEKITDTESYMIAIIHKESTTVAQIAKKIGMSRQGHFHAQRRRAEGSGTLSCQV